MTNQIIAFRASNSLIQSLDNTAIKLGITRSELVRIAAECFLENASKDEILFIKAKQVIAAQFDKMRDELTDAIYKQLKEGNI